MILNIERFGYNEEMQRFIDWLEFEAPRSSKSPIGHAVYEVPQITAITFNPLRLMSMDGEQLTVKCDSVTYDGSDFTLTFGSARIYMVAKCSR